MVMVNGEAHTSAVLANRHMLRLAADCTDPALGFEHPLKLRQRNTIGVAKMAIPCAGHVAPLTDAYLTLSAATTTTSLAAWKFFQQLEVTANAALFLAVNDCLPLQSASRA
jgi:hypothetical protein